MTDDQAILRAAGITNPPPGDVIPKILNYGLLRNRVFDHLVEMYASEVLASSFRESELEHLRVSVGAEVRKPKFRVTWGIVAPDLSRSNSKPLIVGSSYVGDSQTPDEKFFWQPRTIEEARQIRFRGESVPGDLLYQYSSQYLGGGMDPMALADRQQNEINKAQAAQEKQNRLTPAY